MCMFHTQQTVPSRNANFARPHLRLAMPSFAMCGQTQNAQARPTTESQMIGGHGPFDTCWLFNFHTGGPIAEPT
jgi:hypothetical protein